MAPPRDDALPLARELGSRIRALREATGVPLPKFAAKVGLTKGYLSPIETGIKLPRLEALDSIALHLGVELLDLFVSPAPDRLRHRVIEATRGLPDEKLRAMLDTIVGPPVEPPPKPPFEVVAAPRGKNPPPDVVPYIGYDIAAGGFEHIERSVRWVKPRTTRRLHRDHFVARVIGRSMEPTIRDGEYCIFSRRVPTDIENGAVVLAKYGGHVDADTSTSFTVKRFHGVPAPRGSEQRWSRVELRPENPSFVPLVIEGDRLADLAIVAELFDVLRPDATT